MAHTLTSKGQVTIPKKIRDHLGLKPGCKVEFEVDHAGGVKLLNAKRPLKRKIDWDKVANIPNTGLSTADIMMMTRGRRL